MPFKTVHSSSSESKQNFVISENPPKFGEGLEGSWAFGSTLRGTQDPQDRPAFEQSLKDAGVKALNFRLWIGGDYTMPAVQAAWLGWQGRPLNLH